MEDGSIYGKYVYQLNDDKEPFWMERNPRLAAEHYFAYLHFTDNHRFSSIEALNLIKGLPNHDRYSHGPKNAYLRLGKDMYFSAKNFQNFYHGIPNFDRRTRIFVTMPHGPIFSASLVERNDAKAIIGESPIPPEILVRYSELIRAY